jgi:phage tail-like protein
MAAGVRSIEAATGLRFDPIPAYLFFVELSGVFVALFSEVSGIEVERKTEEVKEGGVNNHVHILPGRMEQHKLTLKRGLSLSRGLWDWMQQGRYDFKVRRINFSIVQGAPGHNMASIITSLTGSNETALTLFGQGFGKVKHWDIEDAYPVKWKVGTLKSDSTQVAIEELEVVHHGMSLSYEILTPMSLVAGAADLIPL